MSNLTIWGSQNGLNIPPNISDIVPLTNFVTALTHRETQKIVGAFDGGLYDMATEYTWNRTINILRDKVLALGKDFVLEMLGRTNAADTDYLTEVDVINLAADLGFINKTAKLQLLQASENIEHFSSRDAEEEMDKTVAQMIIKTCIKYVLGISEDGFDFSFNNFRDNLKQSIVNERDSVFKSLMLSPYFYKRTAVRTLLNLAKKTPQGGELQNVFTNMQFIIPEIWKELFSEDRWPIGFSYAEAVNEGNKDFVKVLKSILLKVKGFDYVPENLRSLTFVDAANEVIKVHHERDNYYHEPAAIKTLLSLGTSIPSPAFGQCMTAVMACKLGNRWGRSVDAQQYLDEILGKVSNERWEFYMNEVLPGSELILYKLNDQSSFSYWVGLIEEYNFDKLNYKNTLIAKLVNNSKKKKTTLFRTALQDLVKNVRGC